MNKHIDHGPRLSVFLRASQLVKIYDTSSYQDTFANTANIALSAALAAQKH